MNKLICPDCGRKLKLFEKLVEDGSQVELWRCKKCKKEMYLAFDETNNLVKSRSCWTDYYGNERRYLG